jgi:hypothetical protein
MFYIFRTEKNADFLTQKKYAVKVVFGSTIFTASCCEALFLGNFSSRNNFWT